MNIGDKVPEILGLNEKGEEIRLSDYKGKKIVLYFYPKDNTPGCTRQACAFRNVMDVYENMGVKVIGVSKDSQKAHTNFTEKHELNFTLLSDPELEAIQAYGVWQEKKITAK